jgi:hypothetical protein
MRMSSRAWLLCIGACGALAVMACGGDDDTSDSAGTGGNKAGSTGGAGSKADSGGVGGTGSNTLCAKYGGKGNIATVIKEKVIPELTGDCRINAFFSSLSAARVTHLQDCLAIQAEELFACPGVKYEGAKSSNDMECRSMKVAHTGLKASGGDFDALIEDVAKGLKAGGVEDADIATAGAALGGLEDDIVENASEDTASKTRCP